MIITTTDINNALDVLNQINDEYRYEMICKLNPDQKIKYSEMLKHFEEVNGIKKDSTNYTKGLSRIKGKALEDLVIYLLKISGNLFEIDKNLRNTTNEIDQIFKLSPKGKALHSINLINQRFLSFLGECKNYSSSISVTYTGKFCSLLLTNQVLLGIIFSYHGVSGKNWSDSAGLIKKFYLHKEKEEDRYCIIDFNIKDFKDIENGKNFLQIIDEKLTSLIFDVDYTKYLSKHPAEQ